MARAVKKEIEIKLLIDSRECDVKYVNGVLDSRIGKDGIKISEYEVCTVKPLDVNTGKACKTSTGDIGFMYREKGSNSEWTLSNFCIERKGGLDLFSSLYGKANNERLQKEILRAKDYGLSFYFVCDNTLSDTIAQVKKVPKLKMTNCENTHFEQLIKFNRFLTDNGFDGIIVSGKEIAWTIRRLVKKYVKDNKLQYKV